MSSLNPLAGSGTGAGATDAVALEVAALKADAEALRTLLASGDIVAARVLPFNGLTDLLEILGKRVAASLPPTVRPGETLVLEVAGFDGDRIIVRNLGVDTSAQQASAQSARSAAAGLAEELSSLIVTPGPLPEVGTATLPEPQAAAAYPQSASSTEEQPGAAAQATEAPPTQTPPGATPPNQAQPQQVVRQTSAQGSSPATGYPRVTIAVPSRAIETDQLIEARLIAARATVKPPIAPAPSQARPGAPAAPNPNATTARGVPLPPIRVAPSIASRTPAWIETSARPAAAAAPPEPGTGEPTTPAPSASVTAQRSAQAYREPVLLLRSLHIPVTPTNVAAAKLALETPQRLPVALAALERALPLGNADPRVNTMRTIAAFVSNLDPRSENFAAQLSAYISHVVEGPEPKLAQMLQAFARAAPELPEALPEQTQAPVPQEAAAQPGSAPAASHAAREQPHPQSAQTQGAPQPDVTTIARQDPVIAGRIAERTAAIDYDLKTQLQSFIVQPPPNASPASLAAAQNALAALTAAQLNNAVAQLDPRALTISIPLPFMGDKDPARITISREKPQSKEQLDADNFHIAFVLDTKNVGIVAVDLQTAGRAVNVSVKSETPRYAAAFKSKLDQLGGRLEQMRYNVVSLESQAVSRAGATVTTAAPPAANAPDDEPASGLDLRA
ncbi:MAG TPA: hypothetical protein VN905_08545 [Candidatus Binatia bacterium]|nr:hypothetical protein [Candidatus Binatia bacterium]